MYVRYALIKPKINVFQNKLFMNKISIFFKAARSFFYSLLQHFSHVLTLILFIFFVLCVSLFLTRLLCVRYIKNKCSYIYGVFSLQNSWLPEKKEKIMLKKTAIFRFCCACVFLFFFISFDIFHSCQNDIFAPSPLRLTHFMIYHFYTHYYPF